MLIKDIVGEPLKVHGLARGLELRERVLELLNRVGLTYLFITHHLLVVEYISQRIAVMYLGRIVELARTKGLFENPLHPYTQALLSAIPIPDPEVRSHRTILKGDVPSPIDPPSGCVFRTRCFMVAKECKERIPDLVSLGDEHYVACHRVRSKSRESAHPSQNDVKR